MKSYRTEQVHYSTPASNTLEIRQLIMAPNSKPFYDIVLSFLTDDYQHVTEFGSTALKQLQTIPSAAGFDCNADVVHILGGLVQAGLAKSRRITYHEGENQRLCGGVVEYCITN